MSTVAAMPPHLLDPTLANPGPKKKKRNKISKVIASEAEQHGGEAYEESREQQKQHSTSPPPPLNPMDEIPIPKAGPKSFEELLEQELAKEGAHKADPGGRATPAQGTFLKRGAFRGISSYFLPRTDEMRVFCLPTCDFCLNLYGL